MVGSSFENCMSGTLNLRILENAEKMFYIGFANSIYFEILNVNSIFSNPLSNQPYIIKRSCYVLGYGALLCDP